MESKPIEGTYAYGDAFEHFVICEVLRINEYTRSNYKASFFETSAGGEIDLILSKPGQKNILIEIKSRKTIDESEVSKLAGYRSIISKSKCYYISQCKDNWDLNEVKCCFWKDGINEIFNLED